MEVEYVPIAWWMRTRRCELDRTGDAQLQIECRPAIPERIKTMLAGLLGTDVVLKPRSEWPDRPTWKIAIWWIEGLIALIAFTFVWGLLFSILNPVLHQSASAESLSLVALGITLLGASYVGARRYLLDRPHPALDQHQLVKLDAERIRIAKSETYGPCWGLLESCPPEREEWSTSELNEIAVVEVDHPGPVARATTRALEIRTDDRRLHVGHGVDDDRLEELAEALRARTVDPEVNRTDRQR